MIEVKTAYIRADAMAGLGLAALIFVVALVSFAFLRRSKPGGDLEVLALIVGCVCTMIGVFTSLFCAYKYVIAPYESAADMTKYQSIELRTNP